MASQVYANMMAVSCKAAAGKSICAFPDVCMTPPMTPATPPGVPIPYPNTGMASDTTSGSTSVKVSGQEVMLKNKSYFKRSMGDEAGCAPKKGVVTSQNMGKVYFTMWSMDVKIEGENVVRMMDMTTHNHASPTPNSPPWMYLDEMAPPNADHPCHDQIVAAQEACKDTKLNKDKNKRNCKGTDCEKCMQCILVPKSKDKKMCCAPNNTGHHMIEDHWLKGNGNFPNYRSNRGSSTFKAQSLAGSGVQSVEQAPTVCANRFRSKGSVHRNLHNVQGAHEESFLPGGGRAGQSWNYGAGKAAAMEAHKETFKNSSCDKSGCLEKQLDNFYGSDPDRELNPPEKAHLGDDREKFTQKYGSVDDL